MRTTLSKQAVACVAASIVAVLIGSGTAFGHVDPDPLAMQAGTSGTVAFTITHGCDGSPTTSVKFQIPEGVTDVSAVDKPGWTATVTGGVLEFAGGPLAADEEDHFDINLTAPAQAGDVRFPTIQTCEQGELAWIEIEEEGAEEPDHPAPVLRITEGPPTADDLTPEEHADDSGSAPEASSEPAVTAVTSSSDDDSSSTGAIVAIVAAIVVVAAGGGLVLARRRRSAPAA